MFRLDGQARDEDDQEEDVEEGEDMVRGAEVTTVLQGEKLVIVN